MKKVNEMLVFIAALLLSCTTAFADGGVVHVLLNTDTEYNRVLSSVSQVSPSNLGDFALELYYDEGNCYSGPTNTDYPIDVRGVEIRLYSGKYVLEVVDQYGDRHFVGYYVGNNFHIYWSDSHPGDVFIDEDASFSEQIALTLQGIARQVARIDQALTSEDGPFALWMELLDTDLNLVNIELEQIDLRIQQIVDYVGLIANSTVTMVGKMDDLIEAVNGISISADGSTINFNTNPITDKLDEVITAIEGISVNAEGGSLHQQLDTLIQHVTSIDENGVTAVLSIDQLLYHEIRNIEVNQETINGNLLTLIDAVNNAGTADNSSVVSAIEDLNADFNDTFSDLQNMYPTDTTTTFSGLASLNWDSTMNGLYSAVLSDPAATLQLYRVPEMNDGLYVPEGNTVQILSDTGFPNTLELTYGGVTHYVPLYNADGTSAVQGENLFMNYEGIASCYSDNVFQLTGGLTCGMGDVPGMYTMSWGEVVSIDDQAPYVHFQIMTPSFSVIRFEGLRGNVAVFERPVGLGTFMFRSAGISGTAGVYASVENFKLEHGSVATDFAPSVYTIVGIYRESEGIWYALDTSGVKHYFGYDSAVILEEAFNYQVLSDVSNLTFGDGTNMMYIDKGTLTISYTTGAKFFTWYVNWERGSRAWWDSKLDTLQTGGSTDLTPLLTRMDTIIENLGAEVGAAGCEHVYVVEVNQEQTCILPGLQTHTCELCGSSYSEILESLGHDWQCTEHVEDELDPETGEVISSGYDIYTCSICSDTYNDYDGDGTPEDGSTSITGIVSRVFEKIGSLVGELLAMAIRLLDKLLTGFDEIVTSFNEKTQQIVSFGNGYTTWLSGFWGIVPSDLQLALSFCVVVICLGIIGKKVVFAS